MRLNWTDFGRKWQLPWLLAFGTLPAALIYCVHGLDGRWTGAVALAALYGLLATLCLPVRGRLRLAAGALCAVALLGAGCALLPVGQVPGAILMPVLYAAMLVAGLQMGGWERGHELPLLVGALCLTAHIVAQVLVNVDKRQLYSADVRALLTAGFIGFAALMLLSLNRSSLGEAVQNREAVPAAMRRKNVLLTLGLLAATLLLASVPAIIRAVRQVWEIFKTCIIVLLRWLASLLAVESEIGGEMAGERGEIFFGESSEPGALAVILEKILIVFALILAAVLVAFALRMLWRKLKVVLAKLWRRLGEFMAATTEDYEDEVADTREEGERARLIKRRPRRRPARRLDERKMSPAERIRYRYWMLAARHPEWEPSSTARENLPRETASIYERARYSEHPATAQDAEQFAERTRQ